LAVIALALALAIVVLWGAYAHPGELFGTLAFFLVANLLMTHTVACFALIAFIGFLLILRRPDHRPSEDAQTPKLLADRTSNESEGEG
jgi:lysylphosphatidylglycerol synthetase-like protein (DUF2156 family)